MKSLSLLLAFALFACTKPGPVKTGAADTLRSYREAVLKDRPKSAYALLDEETQKKIPYTWFLAQWKKNRREMMYQVRTMSVQAPKVTVHFTSKTGTQITLVTEKGHWKVDEAPGLMPSPETPQQLMALMIKAIDTLDLPLYLSLLSSPYRDAVVNTLRKKMADLQRASSKLPKNKSDVVDQVTVPLDAQGNIQLILKRTSNGWRVDSWQLKSRARYR